MAWQSQDLKISRCTQNCNFIIMFCCWQARACASIFACFKYFRFVSIMDHADIFLTDLEAQLLIEVAFSGLYFCANCDDHFIRVFVCVSVCVFLCQVGTTFLLGSHKLSNIYVDDKLFPLRPKCAMCNISFCF